MERLWDKVSKCRDCKYQSRSSALNPFDEVFMHDSNSTTIPDSINGTYEIGAQNILPRHLKPLLFPCKTTHARTFPKRHAFAYSYLLYGIPIIPSDTKRDHPNNKSKVDKVQGKWWLQVRAEDYLARGHRELGFYEKLRMTLREQVCLRSPHISTGVYPY